MVGEVLGDVTVNAMDTDDGAAPTNCQATLSADDGNEGEIIQLLEQRDAEMSEGFPSYSAYGDHRECDPLRQSATPPRFPSRVRVS